MEKSGEIGEGKILFGIDSSAAVEDEKLDVEMRACRVARFFSTQYTKNEGKYVYLIGHILYQMVTKYTTRS
jgi:hypothetical protein